MAGKLMIHQNVKFDELDKRLKTLEKKFKSLEHSVNLEPALGGGRAVQVTGAVDIPKISKLNLTKPKLVELYNDCPEVLRNSAISVEVTADCYRQTQSAQVHLKKMRRRGQYWIFALEDEMYWLFPNVNRNVNMHRMRTPQLLFKLHGEPVSSDSEFIVIRPARVSLMPDGEHWQLEEQGALDFRNISRSSQLQLALKRTGEERQKLRAELGQFHQEHKQFHAQLAQLRQERQQFQAELEQYRGEYQKLHLQINQISQERSLIESYQEKIFKTVGQLEKIEQRVSQHHNSLNRLTGISIVALAIALLALVIP